MPPDVAITSQANGAIDETVGLAGRAPAMAASRQPMPTMNARTRAADYARLCRLNQLRAKMQRERAASHGPTLTKAAAGGIDTAPSPRANAPRGSAHACVAWQSPPVALSAPPSSRRTASSAVVAAGGATGDGASASCGDVTNGDGPDTNAATIDTNTDNGQQERTQQQPQQQQHAAESGGEATATAAGKADEGADTLADAAASPLPPAAGILPWAAGTSAPGSPSLRIPQRMIATQLVSEPSRRPRRHRRRRCACRRHPSPHPRAHPGPQT